MLRPLLAVVVVAALAGCSSPAGEDGPRSSTTSTSATSTTTGGTCPPDCNNPPDTNELSLVVTFDAGGHGFGVPFPHGDFCLQPDEWALGEPAFNATADLRRIDYGDYTGIVLWLETEGPGGYRASIDLRNRSACQTFRYDPWSVDPDPEGQVVPVLADAAANLTVEVGRWQGYTGQYTTYKGETRVGWTAFQAGPPTYVIP